MGSVIDGAELVHETANMAKQNNQKRIVLEDPLFIAFAVSHPPLFDPDLHLESPGTGSSETTYKYPPPQPEYIAPAYRAW